MVSNLQFVAVAAYLLWCLFASLSDLLGQGEGDPARGIDESDENTPVTSARGAPWGQGGRKGVR